FLDKNENIGYGKACNDLAAAGDSPLIGFFNADVWFMSEHNLADIIKAFDDSQIAVLGPKQRDEKGIIRHCGIIGSNIKPKHRGWGESDPHDLLYKDKIECVTVSGSALITRREIWEEMTD